MCIIYNFSPWTIKVLPQGEALRKWESSSGFALPGEDLSDSAINATPTIEPNSFRVLCLPIIRLDGLKIQITTKKSTKNYELVNECINDFSIFVLLQRAEPFSGFPEKREPVAIDFFLDVKALNNSNLISCGSAGMCFAGVTVATKMLDKNLSRIDAIGSYWIKQKCIAKTKPTRLTPLADAATATTDEGTGAKEDDVTFTADKPAVPKLKLALR